MNEFSSEEIAAMKQAFQKYDKDKDGIIATRELGLVLRVLGQNPTEQELTEIINTVDENGTGRLSFKVFTNIMQLRLQSEDSESDIREAFKVFDKDGSGTISSIELRTFMTTMGEKLTNEEVDELIADADIDGDGEINYEEFVRMMSIK